MRRDLRCRRQSYLKQRRQKSVWKLCISLARLSGRALSLSMFAVQSGAGFSAPRDVRSCSYLPRQAHNNHTE